MKGSDNMFGLEYLFALMKIMVNVGFAIVVSWPFSISWNCIAPKYLAAYIAPQFVAIPFWHFVAFILVAKYLGEMIQSLVPTIVKIDNSSKQESK